MMQKEKRKGRQKGLTLLEVILVMVVLAIVSGVYYAKVLNKGTQTAKVNALTGVVENVIDAVGQFVAANGCTSRLYNCGGLFTDSSTDFANDGTPNLVGLGFLSGTKTPLAEDGIEIRLKGTNAPEDRVAQVTLKIGDQSFAVQAYNVLTNTFRTSNLRFCDPQGGQVDLVFFFVPPTLPPVDLSAIACP